MACGQGQVEVRDYWRTVPRRKRKAPATYWTCHHGHRTCGVHHGSQAAALRHSRKLNTAERRQGRRAGWEPEKVTR